MAVKMLKIVALGACLSLTSLITHAAPVQGPVWPAPGGTSFNFSGDMGRSGGSTLTLFGFDFGAFDQLWWGPGELGLALDGAIDSPGESLVFNGGTGGTNATWTGTTTLNGSAVTTRFTAQILAGNNWQDPTTVPIPTADPLQVSEITTDPFIVSLLFEAGFTGSALAPYLDFFDANTGQGQGFNAIKNFNGKLFVSAIPLPPAVLLLLTGIGALFGYAGLRKHAGK